MIYIYIKRTKECNSQIYEQIHVSVPHVLQHVHIFLLIHLVLFASCLLSSGETVSVVTLDICHKITF